MTDTSHDLHMSESHNNSDNPPHSNSQRYTTYDMIEQKTCVKNKIKKNGESKHLNIVRTPFWIKARERGISNDATDMTHSHDNKAYVPSRPGETTWMVEQTHGRRKGQMKIICYQRACNYKVDLLGVQKILVAKLWSQCQVICTAVVHCLYWWFCLEWIPEWNRHEGQPACCAHVNAHCVLKRHN